MDVRATFSAIPHTTSLCPFPGCNFTTSPRHQQDSINHLLSQHVQFKRFACDQCPQAYPTLTQLRNHLRKAHALAKFDIEHKLRPINDKLQRDLLGFGKQILNLLSSLQFALNQVFIPISAKSSSPFAYGDLSDNNGFFLLFHFAFFFVIFIS